ncbi:MAG TPA: double-strand break repair helicase AddA [Roseiarcus sp.]|nr:double-strand break repair helicase AddA [Roseiarcus sp.]
MNAPVEAAKLGSGGADPQARASDPGASAWVTANAGSGKTHVLVQRVLRLLLEGTPPSRILCLTFTKNAAANMAGRIFKTLANWTSIDDEALAGEIAKSGAKRPDAARLALARRLFARTIESPGGLKIETIHGFCGRLLRMFPFEANVAAGFRVVEEREAKQLLNAAQESALAELARDPVAAARLRALATETGRQGLDALLGQALQLRAAIQEAILHWGDAAAYGEALRVRLGLAPREDSAAVEESILSGLGDRHAKLRIAAQLGEGSVTDQERAAALRAAAAATDRAAAVAEYFKIFFTREGKPRGGEAGKLVTNGVAKKYPSLDGLLRREQNRLIGLCEKLKAARTAERSLGLVLVAERVLAAYARLKAERGLLDFDDLIERANALLERTDAAWVLFKLDSGIDHILVDEAQDTSREQWRILKKIAEDFTAGKSARETPRTFFAVGDDKQSIFSFQGAAPDMFAEMRRLLQKRHDDANLPFAPVSLTLSYRSAKIVLDSIDDVFLVERTWRGLTADNEAPPPHVAFRGYLPGLVEVWPPIGGEKEPLESDWRLPLDAPANQDPPVLLARRIAKLIADWLKPGSTARVHDPQTKAPRPIRPGDILILVRARGAFFEAMIRALKEAQVRTLGADRLLLSDHIAVMDLMAAGKAALNADDDLSLAAALKSPLFGFSDDDLIALAPERKASLADALVESLDDRHRAAARRLALWRERARALSPYDFYARLLGEEGGKRAMLGRLGPEAGDAIEEFLSLALAFERRQPPSLIAFLAEVAAADVSIKRDMEESGDAVRVMTVHAAKGLEAPVVFLPDTCSPAAREEGGLFALPAQQDADPPFVVWSPRKAEDPEAVAAARDKKREEARGEHRRLLYVAMTRAAERLIIAGYHGVKGPAEDCWRDLILAGLANALTEAPAPWSAAETILRRGAGASEPAAAPAAAARSEAEAPPVWLSAPAPPGPAPLALTAAAGRAPFAAAEGAAANRLEAGRLSHALLQYLPDVAPARRGEAGRRYLASRSVGLGEEEREAILGRVLALLGDASLAALFGPASRAEVTIAAEFPRKDAPPAPFVGRIDRLAILPDHVAIADFKSGAPRPGAAPPADYIAQLALYRAALLPLYPERPVRAFLVWLDSAELIEIDPEALDAAFAARLTGA